MRKLINLLHSVSVFLSTQNSVFIFKFFPPKCNIHALFVVDFYQVSVNKFMHTSICIKGCSSFLGGDKRTISLVYIAHPANFSVTLASTLDLV